MQKAFVTGAAGFIGSTLVDRLLADGAAVTGWDNFSTGQERFLDGALKNPLFRLVRGDNLDLPALTAAMSGADFVFHLAANADIKDGWSHPRKDLDQNTIATFNVLEAMRANGVKHTISVRLIAFVGMCRQELDIANEVSQAKLDQHAEVLHVFAIGAKIIASKQAVEFLAEDFDENVHPDPHPRGRTLPGADLPLRREQGCR